MSENEERDLAEERTSEADRTQSNPQFERRLVVLGGSSVHPSAPLDLLEDLGRRLSEEGAVLVQGGQGPSLEALRTGFEAAEGMVYTVTTGSRSSDYLERHPGIEIRFPDLLKRIRYLVETADAFLVLPGEVEALAELSSAWSFLKSVEPRGFTPPLMVWKDAWFEPLQKVIERSGGWGPDASLLTWVQDADEVLAAFEKEVKIGRALEWAERHQLPFEVRASLYWESFGARVQGCFSALEPVVIHQPEVDFDPLSWVRQVLEDDFALDPAVFEDLAKEAWSATYLDQEERWASEFQKPKRGRFAIHQVARSRSCKRSRIRLRQVRSKIERLGSRGEVEKTYSEQTLRIQGPDAAWVLCLRLDGAFHFGVAARSLTVRRSWLERF